MLVKVPVRSYLSHSQDGTYSHTAVSLLLSQAGYAA